MRGWLRFVWSLATPIARAGIPADVVTVSGLATSVAAARARTGRAAWWLTAGAVADGLDGAVAVLTDRRTAHGTALDHTADRVADVAAAVALVRAGAPVALVLPGPVLTTTLELTRRLGPPTVTVGERPSRVVCGALGDVAAAVTGRTWPAAVAAAVWDVLAVIALGQIVVARRRAATTRSVSSPSPPPAG